MAAELMPPGPFPLFQPEDHFAVRVPLGHQPEGLAGLCKGEDHGVGLGNDAAALHKLRDLLELRSVRAYKQKAVFLALLACGPATFGPSRRKQQALRPGNVVPKGKRPVGTRPQVQQPDLLIKMSKMGCFLGTKSKAVFWKGIAHKPLPSV